MMLKFISAVLLSISLSASAGNFTGEQLQQENAINNHIELEQAFIAEEEDCEKGITN